MAQMVWINAEPARIMSINYFNGITTNSELSAPLRDPDIPWPWRGEERALTIRIADSSGHRES